jgi:hypothetical protein
VVDFGLIDEWNPTPGRLVSWAASPRSVVRARTAPAHPTPPSHQQEAYLAAAARNAAADFRYSGLCVVTAEVPAPLDRDAMTHAVNDFLRRHDTFRSWFRVGAGGRITRHVVEPDAVEFVPTDHGEVDNAEAIRQHVQKQTPGPFEWDCFTFGVIEHGDASTVYAAVDHLHTDGVGQYLTCFELAHLYAQHMWDEPGVAIEPASHLAYCARERAQSAELSIASPGVRAWLELIRGNDGELPSFPLDLGRRTDGYTRSAHLTVPLLDETEATAFERVCAEHGAQFTGGIFAAAALAERELVGRDYYFSLTPISTRASVPELISVGWYATLIPVAFPISPSGSFARVLRSAQRAYDTGMRLTAVSPHRVLELVPADLGIHVPPGWVTPMISYVDARDFTGNEYFDVVRGGVFANRAASEEVLMWINRLPGGTSLSAIYPDTPVAHESVRRYTAALKSAFAQAVSPSGG